MFCITSYSKGHIFIKRVNDCPIIDVDMLEQWSKEFEQSNGSPNIKGYTRRDSAYWRDIAFGVSEESAIQHWLQLQVIFCVGM